MTVDLDCNQDRYKFRRAATDNGKPRVIGGRKATGPAKWRDSGVPEVALIFWDHAFRWFFHSKKKVPKKGRK